MELAEVMSLLQSMGDERTKNTLMKHGAKEPIFGVKVADLKKVLKKTKKNHELSLALYSTGNSDAMYLAGLMADESQISKEKLQEWVQQAYWHYLSEYAVPWVAAETPYGFELGMEWIRSNDERIAAAGWQTLSSIAGLRPDEQLDIATYSGLLDEIGEIIHLSPNRVRYTMNAFVIAVGSYIVELHMKAIEIGGEIGKVAVDMGGTACKVPLAPVYIDKVVKRGSLGKKRKTARC